MTTKRNYCISYVYNYVTCWSSSSLSQQSHSDPGRLFVEVPESHKMKHTNTLARTRQDYPVQVISSLQSIVPTFHTTNTKHPYRQRYSNPRFQHSNGRRPSSYSTRPPVSACATLIHHLIVCLTIGPKPPPKRGLHIARSRASSFK